MSNSLEELPPWGGLRWFFSVSLLLLLHLGALFLLSGMGERPAMRQGDDFSIRLLTEPGDGSRVLAMHALNDPTLLASASPRGFSGPAWLNITPPPFRLPDWTDDERWLTQRVAVLGDDFRVYVRTNLGSTLSVVSRPPTDDDESVGKSEDEVQSRLYVVGDLARRQLLDRPDLESLTSADVLLPTRIEVLVNKDGFVFSPRLQSGGLDVSPAQRAADQTALRLIPNLRFAATRNLPASDEFPFTRGTIIFQWVTKAVAPTNNPANAKR